MLKFEFPHYVRPMTCCNPRRFFVAEELSYLPYFVAVAQTLNFRRGAKPERGSTGGYACHEACAYSEPLTTRKYSRWFFDRR